MAKTDYQIETENNPPITPRGPERRIISKPSNMHDESLRVGDVVTVKQWGTFGCWDESGRWVDFYCSEEYK